MRASRQGRPLRRGSPNWPPRLRRGGPRRPSRSPRPPPTWDRPRRAQVPGAKAADPIMAADTAGKDAGANQRDADPRPAPEAKDLAPAPSANDFNVATNAAAQANSATALAHAAAVRGSPQTVANLAAQIA